jgi:hypothetical protein
VQKSFHIPVSFLQLFFLKQYSFYLLTTKAFHKWFMLANHCFYIPLCHLKFGAILGRIALYFKTSIIERSCSSYSSYSV